MQEKYNDQFEKQIKILTQSNVETGKYKVLDYQSRIVARAKFPELVKLGRTENDSCLVNTSRDGETFVITKEFETAFLTAVKNAIL